MKHSIARDIWQKQKKEKETKWCKKGPEERQPGEKSRYRKEITKSTQWFWKKKWKTRTRKKEEKVKEDGVAGKTTKNGRNVGEKGSLK